MINECYPDASTRTSCITSVPLPGPPESTLMNTMYFNGNILHGWVFCCGNKVWNTSAVWIKCQTARGNQPLLYYQLLFQSLCTFSEWTLGHKTLFFPFCHFVCISFSSYWNHFYPSLAWWEECRDNSSWSWPTTTLSTALSCAGPEGTVATGGTAQM